MSQPLVGYIRVSTRAGREDERFLSPDLQRSEMERWAATRYVDPEWLAWHVELDRRGTTQSRPVLTDALADAERVRASLVVFALSRWARNVEGGLRDIDRMRDAGVRVESASEPVELETSIGRFGVQILLAVAELDVGQKAEGWKRTIEANKGAGLWHGVVPLGYRRPTDAEVLEIGRRAGIIVPDHESSSVVVDAFERVARGESADALGGELMKRGIYRRRSSIYTMLRNRVYLGEIKIPMGRRIRLKKRDGTALTDKHGRQRYGYEASTWIDGRHEAIVDQATFTAVAARLGGTPRSGTRRSESMWWGSGRLRCDGCGYSLGCHRKPSGSYLWCVSKRRGIACEGVGTPRLDVVEKNGKRALREALKGLRLPSRGSHAKDPLVEAKAQLADAERLLGEGLADAVRLGLSAAEKEALLGSLRADVAEAEGVVSVVSARAAVTPEEVQNVRRLATELVDSWDELDDLERRAALGALDVKFCVGRKGVVKLTAPWHPAVRSLEVRRAFVTRDG